MSSKGLTTAEHYGKHLPLMQSWMLDIPGAPSRERVRAEIHFQRDMFNDIKGHIFGVSENTIKKYFTKAPETFTLGQLYGNGKRRNLLGKHLGYPDGRPDDQLPGRNFHEPLESSVQNFLLTSEAKERGVYGWADVLVVGQHQSNTAGCEYLPGFLHMCAYVREVFRSQPTRLWVHCYYLFGDFLELWVVDRNGLTRARSMIVNDYPILTQLRGFYMNLSDAHLGLNPVVQQDDKGAFVLMSGPWFPLKYYLEDKPITSPRKMISRSPTCFRVRRPQAENNEFVFKLSRKSSIRSSEKHMLELAKRRKVWGVSELICHQNVTALTHMVSCMVTKPLGRPLHKYNDVAEVLEVLSDAIKAHRSLYFDGMILHQDISPGNIIISDSNEAEASRGILIDLDLAMDLNFGPARPNEIVGTRTFMAIGVLESRAHTYRHDLESFFYVFLWTAICGHARSPPYTSVLRRWQAGPWLRLADIKRYDMGNGFGMILSEFKEEFRCVMHVAQELWSALFSPQGSLIFIGTRTEPEHVKEVYERMICSLRSGAAHLRS